MFQSGVFFHFLLNTKQGMHFISFKRPRSANIRSWRVSEEEENIDNQKTQNKIHQKKMNKLKCDYVKTIRSPLNHSFTTN